MTIVSLAFLPHFSAKGVAIAPQILSPVPESVIVWPVILPVKPVLEQEATLASLALI
jgi:hypothetical protein